MKTKKKYQHSAFIPVGGVMKRIDVDAIVYIEARSYKCVFITRIKGQVPDSLDIKIEFNERIRDLSL